MTVTASVIVSTFDSPRYLEKVLWGLENQERRPDEVVIADDGSGEETRAVIEAAKSRGRLNLVHVWHAHEGFRKCRILNQAIGASTGEYLIFIDGDCIARRDFVAAHLRRASRGRFLSGGVFRLDMALSAAVSQDDIASDRLFDAGWLRRNGLRVSPFSKVSIGASRAGLPRLLSWLTTTRPTFNGHNSSAWRSDILRVNGFDERMGYGGLDRELGERLENAGVRGIGIRYEAICAHLEHERGYRSAEMLAKNKALRRNTRRKRIVRTPFGMVKDAEPG